MIYLASTSIYRKQLIEKLKLPFKTEKPICDEEHLKNHYLQNNFSPVELAEALSKAKGESLKELLKTAEDVIISGDQLIEFEGQIVGKAYTKEKAFTQLKNFSGKTHQLITAVSLITLKQTFHLNHISRMTFKKLNDSTIKKYIEIDQPLDCAGSYKIESHGINLFSSIDTTDFTAIQGLPLIWLSTKLEELGHELFTS